MLSEKSFVRVYAEAEDMERINIIFKHFDNFQRLIEMFEEDLRNTIKEEKQFNKRSERGDLGVRVQTSFNGDPTGNGAVRELELVQDIRSGNITKALKGADEDMDHQTEIATLKMMRSDYSDIVKAIETLKPRPRAELMDALNGIRDLSTIAEDSKSDYDATKLRLNRNRNKVRKAAICLMNEKRRRWA